MPQVVVPVGMDLGPTYPEEVAPGGSPEPFEWIVRLGAEAEVLTAEEYRVWILAFAEPQAHEQLQVTASALAGMVREERPVLDANPATGRRPANPSQVITRLLRRGLLARFDTDSPDEDDLRRLQLHPTGEGLGNQPGTGGARLVGLHGLPVVALQSLPFGLWAFSSSMPNLWAACEQLAHGLREARSAGADVPRLTPADVAVQGLRVIPLLVATRCAFLDRVED